MKKRRKRYHRSPEKKSTAQYSFHSIVLVVITATIASGITYGIAQSSSRTYATPKNTSFAQQILGVESNVLNPEGDYIEKENTQDTVIAENYSVIFHGRRDKNAIALTFDGEMTDGMRANLLSGRVKNSFDKRIIDTLNQTQTKATFFLTGMWITLYPDVTHELANNILFELANHSYTDSSYDGDCYGLKTIPESQDLEEIETTQKLLRDITGQENRYFRFPGGCFSQKNLAIVTNKASLQVVHWDVNGGDGFNNNTQQIITNVVNATQNGSIIILHLNGAPTAPKTAEALPSIIKALKAKGFEFVKVSELLNS